jgi:hypothetical protein
MPSLLDWAVGCSRISGEGDLGICLSGQGPHLRLTVTVCKISNVQTAASMFRLCPSPLRRTCSLVASSTRCTCSIGAADILHQCGRFEDSDKINVTCTRG